MVEFEKGKIMVSEQKILRLGILGAGLWGPNLIRNFHINNQSRVIAVCDKSPKRLDLIQSAYPELIVSKSFTNLVNNKEIDALVIATPTKTHYQMAKKALTAGKHVFIEKPIAATTEECEDLLRLAHAQSLHLFVGHVFVYNAGIKAVKRYLDSGDLGRIYYINMTRTNLGPIRRDVNAFWDLAPHDISILNFWFPEKPVKVSAVGAMYLDHGVEDTVYATYRYTDGMIANIHTSWLNPKKVREIIIVGEKKMIIWDDMDQNHPIKIYDKNVTFKDNDKKLIDTFSSFHAHIHEGDTLMPKILLNEPLKAECEAFLDVVLYGEKSPSSGLDGTYVVNALVAADQSILADGKEVKIKYSTGV